MPSHPNREARAAAIKARIDAVLAEMATTLDTTRRAIAGIEATVADLRARPAPATAPEHAQ